MKDYFIGQGTHIVANLPRWEKCSIFIQRCRVWIATSASCMTARKGSSQMATTLSGKKMESMDVTGN